MVDASADKDEKVSVERELVSKAEEEDMEALLGTYVPSPSSLPSSLLLSRKLFYIPVYPCEEYLYIRTFPVLCRSRCIILESRAAN